MVSNSPTKKDTTTEKVLLLELEWTRTIERENSEAAMGGAQAIGVLIVSSLVAVLVSAEPLSTYFLYADVGLILLIAGLFAMVSIRLSAINQAKLRSVKIEQRLGVETIITEEERANRSQLDNVARRAAEFFSNNDKEKYFFQGYHFRIAYRAVIAFSIGEWLASDGVLTSLGFGPRLTSLNSFPPPLDYWIPIFFSIPVFFVSMFLFREAFRKQILGIPSDLQVLARSLALEA
jgi:membrane protein implicated in regulation of membrane protease activity